MKLTSSRLVAAIVALAVLAASAGPGRSADKIKITIAAHSAPFAPLYHAQASGYFAEEGLDVDIVVTPGAGAVQAVLARDAQFSLAVATYQIAAYERGQPLLALMSVLTRNSVNVVMHKEVARAKGISEKSPLADKIRALKGLRLSGLTPGSFTQQVLLYYLLKAGLDPQKDVEMVGLGTAVALLTALEQRRIDAFAIGTPTPEAAVARGFGLMVVDNAAGEDPDSPSS